LDSLFRAGSIGHGRTAIAVLPFPREVRGTVAVIWIAAATWISATVMGKRWHDINLSGWYTLITLVPAVGLLVALVVNGFIKGTSGTNRFGPDPLVGESPAPARDEAP